MKMLFQLQHLALWQTHLVVVLAALNLPLGLSYVYKGNGLSTYTHVCACVSVCVSHLCLLLLFACVCLQKISIKHREQHKITPHLLPRPITLLLQLLPSSFQ